MVVIERPLKKTKDAEMQKVDGCEQHTGPLEGLGDSGWKVPFHRHKDCHRGRSEAIYKIALRRSRNDGIASPRLLPYPASMSPIEKMLPEGAQVAALLNLPPE